MNKPNKKFSKLILENKRFFVQRVNDDVYITNGYIAAKYDAYFYNNIFSMLSAFYPKMEKDASFEIITKPYSIKEYNMDIKKVFESCTDNLNIIVDSNVCLPFVNGKKNKFKRFFFEADGKFITYINNDYFDMLKEESGTYNMYQKNNVSAIICRLPNCSTEYLIMPMKVNNKDLSKIEHIYKIVNPT